MNLITEYIEYLKDNPEGYWFKRKLYGWGWTPARWQGWVVLLTFVILVFVIAVMNSQKLNSVSLSTNDILISFISQIGVLVLILILICYKKGESPKWQWGRKDNKDKLL